MAAWLGAVQTGHEHSNNISYTMNKFQPKIWRLFTARDLEKIGEIFVLKFSIKN